MTGQRERLDRVGLQRDGRKRAGEFDRIKPRSATAPPPNAAAAAPADAEGRRALFSRVTPPLAAVPLGALILSCSSCRTTTTMTAAQALTAAIPSLHLPVLRRRYPSWMRCPACRRRTWVKLSARRR